MIISIVFERCHILIEGFRKTKSASPDLQVSTSWDTVPPALTSDSGSPLKGRECREWGILRDLMY